MKTQFALVQKFNQEILGIEPRPLGTQSEDEAKLSHHQLVEEANEFLEACQSGDLVNAVDACIDSIFFALGILYKLGIDEQTFNAIFEVVTEANMSKKKGVKAGREGYDAADATKPEGWTPPEETIAKILNDA